MRRRLYSRFIRDVLGRIFAARPLFFLLGVASYLLQLASHQRYRSSLTQMAGMETFGHTSWFRIPMYNSLYRFIQTLAQKEQIAGSVAIEIGVCEGTRESIFKSFGVNYLVAPNFPRVDIHHLPYDNDSFHFVILDQVMEHVEQPWVAVGEVFKVLKPGGIVIATGPFLLGYHGKPEWKDYYRFTPDGWNVLFSRFDVLLSDGWGNGDAVREAWDQADIGPSASTTLLERALIKRLFDTNDRINYLVTWCVARKPITGQVRE